VRLRWPATDRIIVMHRGRKVAELVTGDPNTTEIVEYMVGARQQPGLEAPRAAS
jgi:ABC-type sugar transport system ATPase subunit